MKSKLKIIEYNIYKIFLKLPLLSNYSRLWYRRLGVNGTDYYYLASNVEIIGNHKYLEMGKGSIIRDGGLLLLKNKIKLGENTAIAHQVLLLTSANPNGPRNKLSKVYPKICKPIIIGDNTWIGARVTILPGITIGDFCIVAAGSVVTKDIPDYTVVAGVPAKEVKKLDPADFI